MQPSSRQFIQLAQLLTSWCGQSSNSRCFTLQPLPSLPGRRDTCSNSRLTGTRKKNRGVVGVERGRECASYLSAHKSLCHQQALTGTGREAAQQQKERVDCVGAEAVFSGDSEAEGTEHIWSDISGWTDRRGDRNSVGWDGRLPLLLWFQLLCLDGAPMKGEGVSDFEDSYTGTVFPWIWHFKLLITDFAWGFC